MKFRRQHPIGSIVVDFVCLEKKLVIEVDGGQHAKENEKDLSREEWLASEGFKVLRYWNDEVLKETKSVMEDILSKIGDHPPPTPPLKGGG
jgi:very-short-patch-repair endonuclease